jgi:hypothetical protein
VNAPAVDAALREQVLVDLSLWLSRVQQYSAAHPVCAQLGDNTHRTIARALAVNAPLSYGVLKDAIMIDGAPAKHPVVRSRVAPHLHARGVLLLRFSQGVTVEELAQLIELLALPEQTIFDRGGLTLLTTQRRIARIQIEEIAHDLSAEERDAKARREKFRLFFRDMLRTTLWRRRPDATLAEQIAELLEHPEVIVTILEEDALGIAEAAAGLALIVRQEQQRTGEDLVTKLTVVFLALAASSRVRLLLGFPSLAGEFRSALSWVLDAMGESELARLVFPSVRAHAQDLEPVLYALSAAVPHDGTRYSALRLAGLKLFDLVHDDAISSDVIRALAEDIPEYDSFRRERECLREHAVVAARRRGLVRGVTQRPAAHAGFNGARAVGDVIEIASRARNFDHFCTKLAVVAKAIGRDGAASALRALSIVADSHPSDEVKNVAARGKRDVVRAVATDVIAELEAAANEASEASLPQLRATALLFAREAPEAMLNRLDSSESRAFRRIVLDVFAECSSVPLALIRARLASPKWYVVRNAVLLLLHAGGTAADLVPIANHPREQVRIEIVRVLRQVHESAAMDIIALYLVDPSAQISEHAPAMLRGELLSVQAIARLEAIASDEHQAEELRKRVVYALGRSPRDEAAAALLRILHPKSLVDLGGGAIRDIAASMLRHSPAPNAEGYFEQGLHSLAWRVRKACERARERR